MEAVENELNRVYPPEASQEAFAVLNLFREILGEQ